MAIMDEQPRRKPAVLPPPPGHPDDGPDPVRVPPLEPPPSSLKPTANAGSAGSARESRVFWLLLVVLFAVGTALTVYLQR